MNNEFSLRLFYLNFSKVSTIFFSCFQSKFGYKLSNVFSVFLPFYFLKIIFNKNFFLYLIIFFYTLIKQNKIPEDTIHKKK